MTRQSCGTTKGSIRKTSYDGSVAYDIIEPVSEPIENTTPKRKARRLNSDRVVVI